MGHRFRFLAVFIFLYHAFLCIPAVLAVPVSVVATVLPYQAVVISDLSYTPAPYDPTVGRVQVNFNLSKASRVDATIFDMSGLPVNLLGPYSCQGGANTVYWDGRKLDGTMVAPSWYPFYVGATDGITADEKMVLMAVSYGKPLSMKSLGTQPKQFDPKKGTVKVMVWLSRDAYVNIEIKQGKKSIKNVKGLFWFQGNNFYTWDGTNDKGQVVSPGTYECLVSGKDSGGNSASIAEIIVVSK